MKTKRQFINDIYFQCKAVLKDDSEQKIYTLDDNVALIFYLDEGNETIKVSIDGEYKDLLNELDEETAFRYAKMICEDYLGLPAENIMDERIADLEKGILAWYTMTATITHNVREWFKRHPNNIVKINLQNDIYFIMALEKRVMFRYIKAGEKDQIVVGVSECVYHDNQFCDWFDHEISFDYVLQDAITVSDLMHEFYENTKEE
jgi:hypothetical protein